MFVITEGERMSGRRIWRILLFRPFLIRSMRVVDESWGEMFEGYVPVCRFAHTANPFPDAGGGIHGFDVLSYHTEDDQVNGDVTRRQYQRRTNFLFSICFFPIGRE